jgi:membrane associated rhomboid family serine protease
MAMAPRYCYRHPDRETGLSCSECDRPICYECMTPAPVGLRCPEHSGKPQGIRKVTTAAERAVTGSTSRRINLLTTVLIGVNVAVYALELALGARTLSGTGNWIFQHGVLVKDGIYDGRDIFVPVDSSFATVGVAHDEWWRLMSAAFLHYGPFHLAMNMYSLYFAGSILEQLIGRWRFALLYLVSGLAGSAGALYWSPNSMTVGASGAIFGVLGALLILERRGSIATGGQVLGLIIINLIITFTFSSFISVGGHVGGLVGGIALMFAFANFRRSWQASVGAAAGVAVLAVLLAYSSI